MTMDELSNVQGRAWDDVDVSLSTVIDLSSSTLTENAALTKLSAISHALVEVP